ncbi:MAG: TIM44-like domain-containing protein, partial [Alphaproteobacteria bacterium]
MILDILILIAIGYFVWTRFMGNALPKDLQLGSRKPEGKRVARLLEFPKAPAVEVVEGEPEGLTKLRQAEPDFRPAAFIDGARKAYLYYYECWNKADVDNLERLTTPQLTQELEEQLAAYAEKGQRLDIQVQGVETAEIIDARISGKTAVVDVKFTATQAEQLVDATTGEPVAKGKTKAAAT